VWQESIISEHTDADIRLATEGVARNNRGASEWPQARA
jgi:hypothetical protein